MSRTRAGSPGPWSHRTLVGALAFNAVGLLLIGAGWYRAAGSHRAPTQLRWTEVSVAGLALAAIGNAMWVLRGRRAVGTAARRLFGAELPALLGSVPGAPTPAPADAGVLLSAPGTIRFHRPVCVLLRGHPLDSLDPHSRGGHERTGRRACEVCRP